MTTTTMDAIEAIGAEFAGFGVTATRNGAVVRFVRDGYVRVIATWVGGDVFVVANAYDDVADGKWVAVATTRDEVEQEVHMTVNADVAR